MNSETTEYLGWTINPSPLGRGGFKTVYLLEKDGLKEALKITSLRDDRIVDPIEIELLENELYSRAEREFQLLTQFQGGCVVNLGTIPGHRAEWEGKPAHFYSEEVLSGQTLDKVIQGNSASKLQPEWNQIRTLFATGLDVLERIWAVRTVHRDIKPANIMVTEDANRPFVFFDLGIAFEREGSALTRQRLGPGTLLYRAPETLDADYRANLDFRCDLFSLAVTVAEFASGQHPIHHGARDREETVYRLLHKPATSLRAVRDDLPVEFCIAIDRCMHKKPALRPNKFSDLRKVLEA